MKIYLAGSFIDQKDLRHEAAGLWDLGHEVTGTWLLETKRGEHIATDDWKKKLAIKDMCEVTKADLIILDNQVSLGHFAHVFDSELLLPVVGSDMLSALSL